jgi:superfamily II DNA or RNA helicase
MSLLSWQLEPALAIVAGRATRVLLADEVGLGKTVQAGLVLRELAARGLADRSLIVTPAGLRDQWTGELHDRFGAAAEIADAAFLKRAVASLAAGANPWGLPCWYVMSIDFLKQPEVLNGVASVLWDVVVIDEAHAASGRSDRHAAAGAVCRRARVTVLVTATPHAGDEAAFEALCGLGRLGPEPDRLVIFRRMRGDVGLAASRRSRVLPVRLSGAEHHMHDVLGRYARRVWAEAREGGNRDALLAMAVLQKRALSSAAALASSAARRLEWLSDRNDDQEAQLVLPLFDAGETDDSDAEPDAALAAPGLADRRRERAWLALVVEASRAAVPGERKLAALLRLIARTREPAIVFTEYRDTLARLAAAIERLCPCACLHGGLERQQRAEALRRFARGDVRVLLATDAAGEGLNLQARCRWVINYELPWNPVRLEQRAGRVDRIGQTRTAHALLLVARGGAERAVVARLAARIGRMRNAGPGPFMGSASDLAIADALINQHPDVASTALEDEPPARAPAVTSAAPELAIAAVNEVARLSLVRKLGGQRPSQDGHLPVACLHQRKLRRLGLRFPAPCLIVFHGIHLTDRCGREIDRRLVPLLVPASAPVPCGSASQLRAFVERTLAATTAARHDAMTGLLTEARSGAAVHVRMAHTLSAREAAIRRDLDTLTTRLVQPGLFDRRALREAAAARHQAESLRAMSTTRTRRLEAATEIETTMEVEAVLVVDR